MLLANLTKILEEVKSNLQQIYGKRLKNVILYGSYARKEATAYSDLDILVILDNFTDIGVEIECLSAIGSSLSLKFDITISLIPARQKDFVSKETALLRNVSQEGIAI